MPRVSGQLNTNSAVLVPCIYRRSAVAVQGIMAMATQEGAQCAQQTAATHVILFYKYTRIDAPRVRASLEARCISLALHGRLLVAAGEQTR
jgi:hypothetical protein